MSTETGCGECEGGLLWFDECNCAQPDAGYGTLHEPLCGAWPCPNGCWNRLHPDAPNPFAEGGETP